MPSNPPDHPEKGTAPWSAVPWGEVRAARPVGIPSGTPAAPLHRRPNPAELARQTTITQIQQLFPGVLCWWGHHTHRWWAYIPNPQGGYLVEAADPNALISQLSQ